MTLSQRRSKFVRNPERRSYFHWLGKLVRNQRKLCLNGSFGQAQAQVYAQVYAFGRMAEATALTNDAMLKFQQIYESKQ